jgi:hypothetical protein
MEINDFIYARCVTYIGSNVGKKPRPQYVDRGEIIRGWRRAPGGPREGAAHHPMWAGLYIRKRQPNSMYRRKPNTT